LREGIFQTISYATTTGFVTENVTQWPASAGTLLLLAAFAGGCAGSTAGGIKLVRVLMIYLQGMREVRRLIHPNGVFPIKLGKTPVSDRLIESVWSFFSVYALLFFFSVVVIMFISEIDFLTAFSAVGATLNNLGPGLGGVSENYASLETGVTWVLMFNMMLGRLEIFTLLVLLTPAYWRR
jgi:trk system potassium uptake protein TrkH